MWCRFLRRGFVYEPFVCVSLFINLMDLRVRKEFSEK